MLRARRNTMKKRILVVDDDAQVRNLVRRTFQAPDYEVLEAADGDFAVPIVLEKHPDLILLDMHMPRLDGVAALDEILAKEPGAAVVMLTGDHNPTHAKTAMDRGACDYITKPFDIQTLKTCVTANLLVRG
jgi:DNA-binding response OmpR family regulator